MERYFFVEGEDSHCKYLIFAEGDIKIDIKIYYQAFKKAREWNLKTLKSINNSFRHLQDNDETVSVALLYVVSL